MQLYGGVSLPKATSAHLPNLTQTCLGEREVATHQVGHDLKHTELIKKQKKTSSGIFCSFIRLTHYLSPVKPLVEQGMALRQGLLLSRHHRCLIGPLWAESPVTHTAEAAMAGNCPLLPVYGGHGGRVWVACEKVRTRCLFVSS